MKHWDTFPTYLRSCWNQTDFPAEDWQCYHMLNVMASVSLTRTQVVGKNLRSCVSAHIYAFIFLVTYCNLSSLCLYKYSATPAVSEQQDSSKVFLLLLFFFSKLSISTWHTWQRLQPTEPSHRHSLLSFLTFSLSLGFESTVLCPVWLTSYHLSMPWPPADVFQESLEGSENPWRHR